MWKTEVFFVVYLTMLSQLHSLHCTKSNGKIVVNDKFQNLNKIRQVLLKLNHASIILRSLLCTIKRTRAKEIATIK